MSLLAALALCAVTGQVEAPLEVGAPEALPRMLVLDIRGGEELPPSQLRILNDLVLTEFQKVVAYRVTGESDIATLLTVEQQRQLVGCDDTGCLAEIGGALGAELIASGSVGMLGDEMLFNLKLIRPRAAGSVATWSKTISRSKLAAAAREGVAEVLRQLEGGSPLPEGAVAGPGVDTQASAGSSPIYKKWWLWTIVGAVVVGAAATGIALSGGGGDPAPGSINFNVELPPTGQ